MLIRKQDMRRETRPKMRGGEGEAVLTHLLGELPGNLRIFAKIEIAPKNSIGYHTHDDDAEIFYVLEGELCMDDNGTEVVLRPGDALYTADGDGHAVFNRSEEPAALLAVIEKV